MAIPKTKLHVGRVADQVYRNLIGLQRDIPRNAKSHRAMAIAQSPPVATVKQFFKDATAAYIVRLQWFQDLNDNPQKFQLLTEELTRRGWAQADLLDPFNSLKTAVQGMNNAVVDTYAQIIAACDLVIANVDSPESLWPE